MLTLAYPIACRLVVGGAGATECEAGGDHHGAADLRASAERLDRAGAILAAP